jgi:hypothetical protein
VSNTHAGYNDDVKREFLDLNRSHNVLVRKQKAALLASLEKRSRGVKESRGRDRDDE